MGCIYCLSGQIIRSRMSGMCLYRKCVCPKQQIKWMQRITADKYNPPMAIAASLAPNSLFGETDAGDDLQ